MLNRNKGPTVSGEAIAIGGLASLGLRNQVLYILYVCRTKTLRIFALDINQPWPKCFDFGPEPKRIQYTTLHLVPIWRPMFVAEIGFVILLVPKTQPDGTDH